LSWNFYMKSTASNISFEQAGSRLPRKTKSTCAFTLLMGKTDVPTGSTFVFIPKYDF
jgi:phosphatidylethanolamine-binding protein (PEBP) family uncharacterized protein